MLKKRKKEKFIRLKIKIEIGFYFKE